MAKLAWRRTMILGIVALLVLSSCAQQGTPSATASGGGLQGGTLTIAYPTDPKSFNGVVNNFSYTTVPMIQMFNRLLRYDADYKVVGDLADSFTTSSDGKTWTFKLRQAKWHDGVAFTSADVKFHYDLVKSFKASPAGPALQSMTAIETPDASTAVFKFSSPVRSTAFLSLYADGFILPKHIYEVGDHTTNAANQKPIGTGPFKFESYEPGNSITMTANPDYFGGRPKLDRLVFKFIPTAAAAMVALQAGEIDTIVPSLGIPPSQVATIKANPDLGVSTWAYPTTAFLAFGQQPASIAANPWLSDERVRKAIMMAVDRDFIVTRVLNGVVPKDDTMVSSTVAWAYNKDVKVDPYDVAGANKLLDEAGYPKKANGIRFTMEMPTAILGNMDKASEAMVEMMRQVGIELKVTSIELNAFITKYLRGKDGLAPAAATVISGASGPDPIETYTWYSGNRTPTSAVPGFNFFYYNNPKVNQLYDDANNTFDQAKYTEIWKQIQLEISKDHWVLPLFSRYQIEAWNKKFAGFETRRPYEFLVSYAGISRAK